MRHSTAGLVLVTLGALALSACGEKTESTTTTTTTTTTTAAAPADGLARKAGLWEQTTSIEGMGPATMKICLGSNVAPCAGATVVKTADGYTMSATCPTPNGEMKVEGVAKGDLASAYTLTSKATVAGAETVENTVSLRYVGACPEGMTVGQIQGDEGAVIDMSNFDPAKAREMAGQAGK